MLRSKAIPLSFRDADTNLNAALAHWGKHFPRSRIINNPGKGPSEDVNFAFQRIVITSGRVEYRVWHGWEDDHRFDLNWAERITLQKLSPANGHGRTRVRWDGETLDKLAEMSAEEDRYDSIGWLAISGDSYWALASGDEVLPATGVVTLPAGKIEDLSWVVEQTLENFDPYELEYVRHNMPGGVLKFVTLFKGTTLGHITITPGTISNPFPRVKTFNRAASAGLELALFEAFKSLEGELVYELQRLNLAEGVAAAEHIDQAPSRKKTRNRKLSREKLNEVKDVLQKYIVDGMDLSTLTGNGRPDAKTVRKYMPAVLGTLDEQVRWDWVKILRRLGESEHLGEFR